MAKGVSETLYPQVLSRRFGEYLRELRSVHRGLSVSRLAQELGYADSRFLDRLCEGRDYLGWAQIDDFCSRSGVHADWLKHGEGRPFAPSDTCQPDVTVLLNELDPEIDWLLYLVRSDCRQGRVCFVRKDNDLVWRVYDTLLHLSAENGAGGVRNLVGLYRLLREINEAWAGRMVSHTLGLPEFETLVEGNVFPEAVLRNRPRCHWGEDFPLLNTRDGGIRKLLAEHGREFQAAQAIVRAELASDGERDAAASRGGESGAVDPGAGKADVCPVCAYRRRAIARTAKDSRNRLAVECPRCGPFQIDAGAVRRIEAGQVLRMKMSAWVRAHKESGGAPPTIAAEEFDAIVGTLREHGVAEKQRLLLAAIGRRTRPSESTELVLEEDFGVAWAESGGELRYLLRALGERGLVEVTGTGRIASCEITPTGWEQLDGAGADQRGRGQVFVAMSFDPELEPAWNAAIAPALESSGYEPYRVDKDQHVERIDAKVHDEIDRSTFVVADVTGQKQGVYFEAGYAMGQGIPVVWCVREDQLGKVHFDTRQFNHVVWREPEDLRRKLAERVAGAIGSG